MNTSPINFEFDTNTIRVVEIGGEPWFVAKDVPSPLTAKGAVKRRLPTAGRHREGYEAS